MQCKERPWYRLYQFLLSMIYSSVFMLYFNIFGRCINSDVNLCSHWNWKLYFIFVVIADYIVIVYTSDVSVHAWCTFFWVYACYFLDIHLNFRCLKTRNNITSIFWRLSSTNYSYVVYTFAYITIKNKIMSDLLLYRGQFKICSFSKEMIPWLTSGTCNNLWKPIMTNSVAEDGYKILMSFLQIDTLARDALGLWRGSSSKEQSPRVHNKHQLYYFFPGAVKWQICIFFCLQIYNNIIWKFWYKTIEFN